MRRQAGSGKTPEQQIREGMTWEPIEESKALARRIENLKHQLHDVDTRKNVQREKGEVVDIIARRVGLGSGVSYARHTLF